jgi:hypothetical protein
MERPTPEQALKEYEEGASYGDLEKKYGISHYVAQKLVAMGKAGMDGDVEDGEEEEELEVKKESGPIRVPEFESKGSTYEIIMPSPFHPVCGEGPFKVGDIISVESFPRRKYAEWRLRNLVAEGRAVKV